MNSLCHLVIVTIFLTTFKSSYGLVDGALESEPCQNCISINDCPSLLAIAQSPVLDPASLATLRAAQCGVEGRTAKVCCPSETLEERANLGSSTRKDSLPDLDTCGHSIVDKIVGGKETEIGEFPWLALLEYRRSGNRKGFYCGGVLISPRFILTAAHCVKSNEIPSTYRLISVRLGEHDINNATDCKNGVCSSTPVDVPVDLTIPHPQYTIGGRSRSHDIALVRLTRAVTYNDYIQPICVPTSDTMRKKNLEGEDVVVAGWGKTENASNSNVKLKVTVPVVATPSCATTYRQMQVTLGDGQMCAGGLKSRDSCRGDSGGPLMLMDTSETDSGNCYVFGVVSFGPTPCGTRGWPGVYTRVTNYADWIIDNMTL